MSSWTLETVIDGFSGGVSNWGACIYLQRVVVDHCFWLQLCHRWARVADVVRLMHSRSVLGVALVLFYWCKRAAFLA